MRRANGQPESPVAIPMPELRITIPERLEQKLQSAMPDYLDRKGFVCLLLDQALDSSRTLGTASASEAVTSKAVISSSEVTKEEKEIKATKSRKRTEVTPEFETFWRAYQSCPRKVPSQSKAKSWDEWRKVIKHETPERLVRAAEAAVRDAINCEWDYKLPDCFRWLRDGRYSVLLETHTPAQKQGDWL